MPPENDSRPVHYQRHDEPLDLRGKDLISLFSHPKADLAPIFGPLPPRSALPRVEQPPAALLSMTGEVADELHEWPDATLGPGFRHLRLTFLQEHLIGYSWICAALMEKTKPRPWYRRLFSRKPTGG